MSPSSTNVARSPSTSRSAGASQATTGVPQASASTARQPEALVVGGEHERVRAAVDRGELVVADLAREDHVGQLVRPRARRADEHERQLARRRARASATCLRRVGVLQAADPQQVALGQREALRAPPRSPRRRARYIDRVGRLGDHRRSRSRSTPQVRDGVARRPPRSARSRATARCTARWRRRSACRCAGARCGASAPPGRGS